MSIPAISPQKVVDHMMKYDYFSQWLGIKVLSISLGYCKLQMPVRREMLNGFGIVHGGITFSLADSALAFACNSDGRLSLALDLSITYPKAANAGDVLTAETSEKSKSRNTATYDVEVKNQEGMLVALFRGTVYRTSRSVILRKDEERRAKE